MVFEDKMVILEFFTFWTEIVFHDILIALKGIESNNLALNTQKVSLTL